MSGVGLCALNQGNDMIRAREEASPQSKAKIQCQCEPSTLRPEVGKVYGTQWSLLAHSRVMKQKGAQRAVGSRPPSLSGTLTSRASLRFWVRAPRLSHWSQIFWHRALTLGES